MRQRWTWLTCTLAIILVFAAAETQIDRIGVIEGGKRTMSWIILSTRIDR